MRARFATVAILVSLLLTASCATMPTLRGAHGAWETLVRERSTFRGARSYLKIRVKSDRLRRSFNAKLFVDPEGRMLLSGLSPLGTSIFTLHIDGDDVLLLDHHEKTWWRGRLEDLPEVAGLRDALRANDLAFILLGLPPSKVERSTWNAKGTSFGEIRSGGWDLLVSAHGLANATAADGRARVQFTLPSMPPTKVTIEADGETIEIDHLDLVFGPVDAPEPKIDPGYTEARPR